MLPKSLFLVNFFRKFQKDESFKNVLRTKIICNKHHFSAEVDIEAFMQLLQPQD